MPQTITVVSAIAGGLICAVGYVPYMYDILRGKTKPERAMWWIYTALFTLLFAAQMSAGARWLLVVSGAYTLSAALIAVLSVKYGYGRLHKRDGISLAVAALGLALWLVTNNSLLTILIVIIVDAAGFWLTLVKTWHAPHTETLLSWELDLVGSVIGLLAIDHWTFTIAAYPLYAICSLMLIVWLIMYRRKKVKEDPVDF